MNPSLKSWFVRGGAFLAASALTFAVALALIGLGPKPAEGRPDMVTYNNQTLYVNRNSTQPAANVKQTGSGYALVISSNPTPNGAPTPQAWFLKDGQLIAPFGKPVFTMTPTSTNTPTSTPTATP